jgi:hypothetical protein
MRDNYGGVLKSENLIKKEAKGIDNTDLGEIKDITSNSIITEMNNTYKDKFIIPKDLVERFHEDSVLFQITEKETERYKHKRINLLFISE